MKKLVLICTMAVFGFGQSFAQNLSEEDYGFFNHLSAGISLGTDGIGFEVATPLTYSFDVRAGYSFMPKFKYSKSFDLNHDPAFIDGVTKVDGEGKLNMGDFHLLFDYHPIASSSFRVTAGAYIGKSNPLTVYNLNAFVKPEKWGIAGLEMGSGEQTYTAVSDPKTGNVAADLKVNSFKPYIGVGFGRAVPKGRVGVQFDFGVQFWGKPEIWTHINAWDDNNFDFETKYMKVDKDRITNPKKDYQDARDAVKTIEKIFVYPVLSLKINGRIF
ncbi:MAG: hypothetical protein IKS94_00065 [Prevotella sp.]|nr:hypothetical protein [Prevotella sp.]